MKREKQQEDEKEKSICVKLCAQVHFILNHNAMHFEIFICAVTPLHTHTQTLTGWCSERRVWLCHAIGATQVNSNSYNILLLWWWWRWKTTHKKRWREEEEAEDDRLHLIRITLLINVECTVLKMACVRDFFFSLLSALSLCCASSRVFIHLFYRSLKFECTHTHTRTANSKHILFIHSARKMRERKIKN